MDEPDDLLCFLLFLCCFIYLFGGATFGYIYIYIIYIYSVDPSFFVLVFPLSFSSLFEGANLWIRLSCFGGAPAKRVLIRKTGVSLADRGPKTFPWWLG